jgi:hypothetical protein
MESCGARGQVKHFLISRVIEPEVATDPVEAVEI